MNRTTLQEQLAQKIGISLLFGSITWVILLERGAAALRDYEGSAVYDVAIGPLLLNRISKEPIEDGLVASFTFESGLIGYAIFWIGVGILLGVYGTRRQQRQTSTAPAE